MLLCFLRMRETNVKFITPHPLHMFNLFSAVYPWIFFINITLITLFFNKKFNFVAKEIRTIHRADLSVIERILLQLSDVHLNAIFWVTHQLNLPFLSQYDIFSFLFWTWGQQLLKLEFQQFLATLLWIIYERYQKSTYREPCWLWLMWSWCLRRAPCQM